MEEIIRSADYERFELDDGAIVDFFKLFLTESFSNELFTELMNLNFEQTTIKMFDKMVKIPRLQSWMGDPNVKAALYQKTTQLPWSEKITIIKNKIEKIYNFEFDYALINLYRDGKDHISYHSDNEAIGPNKNIIAGLSLGCNRKFVIRHKEWKERAISKKEFILNNGSLIVMVGDETQKKWKHCVPKSLKVKGPRINITFRHT